MIVAGMPNPDGLVDVHIRLGSEVEVTGRRLSRGAGRSVRTPICPLWLLPPAVSQLFGFAVGTAVSASCTKYGGTASGRSFVGK